MTQRIVFEFMKDLNNEPEKWKRVEKAILDSGGTHLSRPSGPPPIIITAVFPDEATARKIIEVLRTLEGVGRADLDAMREAV